MTSATATRVEDSSTMALSAANAATRAWIVKAAVSWAATLADPTVHAVLISSDLGRGVYERMGYLAVTRWTLWYRE